MKFTILFIKGFLMGCANVIPGVSGGTVALITGIFQELIDTIKSFDKTAIKLALSFKIKQLLVHINAKFLFPLSIGLVLSIVTLARVFKYLLSNETTINPTMSLFFGLILASIYFIVKEIKTFKSPQIICFLMGTFIAILSALITPAKENADLTYVFLCGALSICAMILPGISGSFILILLGNYTLMLSVLGLKMPLDKTIMFIVPFGLGCVFGLGVFSRILSWVFKNYKNCAMALMGGFVSGSLFIIWPWKDEIKKDIIINNIVEKSVSSGYTNWHLPAMDNANDYISLTMIFLGAAALLIMEKIGNKKQSINNLKK